MYSAYNCGLQLSIAVLILRFRYQGGAAVLSRWVAVTRLSIATATKTNLEMRLDNRNPQPLSTVIQSTPLGHPVRNHG